MVEEKIPKIKTQSDQLSDSDTPDEEADPRLRTSEEEREQLQSWNILSFNPKTTDVDEHIDLINTLGDMIDQKEEAKKEKFGTQ